jgi:hypothetical protein
MLFQSKTISKTLKRRRRKSSVAHLSGVSGNVQVASPKRENKKRREVVPLGSVKVAGILSTAVDGDEWSTSRLRRLNLWKEPQ